MVELEVFEGSMEPFAVDEVEKGLGIMKNSKVNRPTGIVKKYLATFSQGNQALLKIVNKILNGKAMPHNWRTSTVVPNYK